MNLRAMKTIYIVLTVCLICGGATLVIWPYTGFSVICRVFGVFLIVYGIAKIIGYFSSELYQLTFQFGLGMGIISIILGIVLITDTRVIVNLVTAFIGLFLVIDAALKIQTAVDSKRFGIQQWGLILSMAVITAVMGTSLIIAPNKGANVMIRLIGVSLLIDGSMNMAIVCNTYRTIKNKTQNIIDI